MDYRMDYKVDQEILVKQHKEEEWQKANFLCSTLSGAVWAIGNRHFTQAHLFPYHKEVD